MQPTDKKYESRLLLLGDERFGCVLTPTGSGYTYRDIYQLTAWSDDPVEDVSGLWLALRDLTDGGVFVASGPQPPDAAPRGVVATATGAVIESAGLGLTAEVRVEVDPSSGVETRRLRLRNPGPTARRLEMTAAVEVVLNPPDAQDGHPAFAKLFVQTALDPASSLLVASRRPRANQESHPVMGLQLVGAPLVAVETDRAAFLGRGRDLRDPAALTAPLTGTLGNVLDPVLAIRTVLEVPAGGEAGATLRLAAAVDRAHLDAALAATAHTPSPAKVLVAADLPAVFRRRVVATGAALAAPRAAPVGRPARPMAAAPLSTVPANGFGEFVEGGREYRVVLEPAADGTLRLPPMPWTQVLANEHFGVIVSEKGSLNTFSGNSRLFRLTPWRNDPVADPHEEAFHLRDEDTGAIASWLPGPTPMAARYEVRHGFGYSTFRHQSLGLDVEVTVGVPRRDPVRLIVLRLENPSHAPRRLALYGYQRLVLGGTPIETRADLRVAIDTQARAVVAENPADPCFGASRVFATLVGGDSFEASLDRRVYVGVPGDIACPRAVVRGGALVVGEPGEACAAIRSTLEIPPGGTRTVVAILGHAPSEADVVPLLSSYATVADAEAALAATRAFFGSEVSSTRIATPEPALDLMVNGWLSYQTLVCRLWARSAYYQSGGAFGFRDQLQDAASLALGSPAILREQILRNASHQFEAGDVLHWWHTPDDRGIRTRFADDLVWLAYLTAHYLSTTGDLKLLEEEVGFVTGPELDADEDERYFAAGRSAARASVYEHCVRALTRAMTRGERGLPLFGCGDWNDGMNRVGREGRGESTFMGFFLVATIDAFLPYVHARADSALERSLIQYREALKVALNDTGWDGDWYRRGYYDSGAPLGSAQSDECRIDALAQAWAVISGVAPPERAQRALDAMVTELVSEEEGLIRLLAPPFVDTPEDPGYIKGYVAGVRENGGQYTHAALWAVRALAEQGRHATAVRLLTMLSPVTHAATPEGVARYKVEPYVIAADVYGVAPHVGRGGWTWYTGSAGWMLRVTLETVLGFSVEAGRALSLQPRIPDAWPGFTLEHRRPDGTVYRFLIERVGPGCAISTAIGEGGPLTIEGGRLLVPLVEDGEQHVITARIGA
jgi:N,N'-diacetylchitobiose phosphorylase